MSSAAAPGIPRSGNVAPLLQESIVRNDFASPTPRTVKQYIEDEYDYTNDLKWPAVAILFAFVLMMRLAVVITTKYLNFQKR